MNCPCGSTKTIDKCCQPILEGISSATTAESLMRSRYTAFTQKNLDYILSSHHPDTLSDVNIEATKQWMDQAQWEKLEVVRTELGRDSDDKGIVEFKAYFSISGDDFIHHEVSEFVKIDDRWFFTRGEVLS